MNPDFHFYLSEMSVSEAHGGGLTLHRVIGPSLNRISRFVHVSRFGDDMPASGATKGRTLSAAPWITRNSIRRVIGCTLSEKLSRSNPYRRCHAAAVARAVLRLWPGRSELRGLICPQGVDSLYATEAIRRLRPLRYVTWMMDDHLVRFVNNGFRYQDSEQELMRRHLSQAEHVFVISSAMGDLYETMFGVKSTVLFGGADPIGEPMVAPVSNDGVIRLAYFGTVAHWQIDSLQSLIKALEESHATLDIYANSSEFSGVQIPGLRIRAPIDSSGVIPAMRKYDAVVLPISFSPLLRNMTDLNIATKMSECLASGTVTLVIGPNHAAMWRYLQDSGAAVLVDSLQPKTIAAGIARIRKLDVRRQVVINARQLVERELTSSIQYGRFETGLNMIARVECDSK